MSFYSVHLNRKTRRIAQVERREDSSITDAIVQESNATDLCQDQGISETATNGSTNLESNMTLENSMNSDEGSVNATLVYGNATTETSLNSDFTKASTQKKIEISPDTVMKYVNKDKNKSGITEKTRGYEKNSLRKKRSTEVISESKRAPLIVNYETAHTPGVVLTPYLQYPLKKQTGNFIQPSVLADFSLQTLHDGPIVVLDPAEAQNYNDDEKKSYKNEEKPVIAPPRETSGSSENDSSESSSDALQSEEIRDQRKENYENKPPRVKYDKSTDEKSGEHEEIEDRSYRRKTDEQSVEDHQSTSRKKPNYDSDESNEGGEKEDYKSNEQSSYEIAAKEGPEEDDRVYDKLKSTKSIGAKLESDSSNENGSDQEYDKAEFRKPHDDKESNENSNQRSKYPSNKSEESDEKPEHRNKYDHREHLHDDRESDEKQDYRRKDRLNIDHKGEGDSGENPNSKITGEYRKNLDKSLESDETSNYGNKDEPGNNRDDSRETKENSEYKKIERKNERDDSEEGPVNRNKGTPDDSNETKKEKHQQFRHPENPLSAFSRDITEREKNNYRKKPESTLDETPPSRKEFEDVKDKPKPFSNLLYSIKNEVDKKKPVKIQDVDLEDFSYERVKLNDKGVVEPIQDDHENYEQDSFEGHAAPTTLRPHDHKERSDYTRKTNEGEIKPVVEISNESSESSEENEQDRPPNLDLIDNDKTVESFHIPKSDESEEKVGKIELTEKQENLKQEFERIPVNYNHDKNKKESTPQVQEPAPVTETSKLSNERDQHDDIEHTPAPKNVQYDDQLGIKFDNTPIKLPEIKLPEDILSYNYKEPVPRNDKFYHHDSEDDEDNVKREQDDEDEDDHAEYGPYKSYYQDRTKDDYKKKQDHQEDEDDDNVDLYEKFVRERFGKRDSFKKRSEKLQQRSYVPNPKLYETIEKILKKTEETEKEALKSGDPNAGYMWTLEYGEKL